MSIISKLKEAMSKSNTEHAEFMKQRREVNAKSEQKPRFAKSDYASENEINEAYLNGKISEIERGVQLERIRANKGK